MSLASFLILALSSLARAGVVEPGVNLRASGALDTPLLSAASSPETLPLLPPSASALNLSPSLGVYERRGVGLLVVDLKDSTVLHRELGNRKAHALVAAALDFAEESSARFDGKVIRHLGDGYLIAFPTYAHALDAAVKLQEGAPALRRALKSTRVEFRAGVYAGRVLVDPAIPDLFGAPVDAALSLAAAADGGEIAVEEKGRVKTLRPGPSTLDRPLDGLDLAPKLSFAAFEQASILFARPGGGSPTAGEHGKRAAHAAVKGFHARARAIVERRGGRVVKTEGETLMAAFSSPAQAARAGAELAGLGARAGVNWGRVLREDKLDGVDYFGNRVNAAARLMALASDGELMADGSLLDDAEAAVALGGAAKEAVKMKGFPEPIAALRLKNM